MTRGILLGAFLQYFISDVLEKLMLNGLTRCDPYGVVYGEHARQEIKKIITVLTSWE